MQGCAVPTVQVSGRRNTVPLTTSSTTVQWPGSRSVLPLAELVITLSKFS
jgi:hypothetical protein